MLARYLWTTLLLTPSTNHQGREWVLNPWLRLMKTSVKNLHNAALQYNKQQSSSNKWYALVHMPGRPPVISSATAVLVLVLNPLSAVAKMGDCLATIDMGQRGGTAVSLTGGAWSFGHDRGQKFGGLCPFLGELCSYLKQCHLGWGLPPHQVASWSIQPFSHNKT